MHVICVYIAHNLHANCTEVAQILHTNCTNITQKIYKIFTQNVCMMHRKNISISQEVYAKIVQLKQELCVNSIDLVLRWLLKMPPFAQNHNANNAELAHKKHKENVNQSRGYSSYSQASSRFSHNDKTDIRALVARAKQYRNNIIRKQGYITTEQLEKIAKKFGLSIEDLWDDLIMKETGKYYLVEE